MFRPHLNMFIEVWGIHGQYKKEADAKVTIEMCVQILDWTPSAPSSAHFFQRRRLRIPVECGLNL